MALSICTGHVDLTTGNIVLKGPSQQCSCAVPTPNVVPKVVKCKKVCQIVSSGIRYSKLVEVFIENFSRNLLVPLFQRIANWFSVIQQFITCEQIHELTIQLVGGFI